MKHEIREACGAITLRALEEGDIEFVRVLRNRHRDCFLYSEEISEEAQKAWFLSYLEKENDYMFAVCVENQCIGAVALYDVDEKQKRAEFGRLMIDKTTQGMKGLGTDATKATCRVAFEHLGLEEVFLEVYEDNTSARKTYERAGFFYTETFCDSKGRSLLRMRLLRG